MSEGCCLLTPCRRSVVAATSHLGGAVRKLKTSTFWFVKSGMAWALSLSGIVWAGPADTWQGRLWLVLLAAAISFTVMAVVFWCMGRELEAMRLGMDMGARTEDPDVRRRETVRPIR